MGRLDLERRYEVGARNNMSPREQIFDSGDPALISKYALKYLLMILTVVVASLLMGEIFSAIDWASAGDGWKAMTGVQRGLVVVGSLTAVTSVAAVGVPRLIKLNRQWDENILEDLHRHRQGVREHRANKRERMSKERDAKRNEFVEDVTSILAKYSSINSKMSDITNAFKNIYSRSGTARDEKVEVAAFFADVFSDPRLKEALSKMSNEHKARICEEFDRLAGLPPRTHILAGIGELDPEYRYVITKLLKEKAPGSRGATIDLDACLEDPTLFSHDDFMGALKRIEAVRTVTYQKGDEGAEHVFASVHSDLESAKAYGLKVDYDGDKRWDSIEDAMEQLQDHKERGTVKDLYDGYSVPTGEYDSKGREIKETHGMREKGCFKFDVAEFKRQFGNAMRETLNVRDDQRNSPIAISLNALAGKSLGRDVGA